MLFVNAQWTKSNRYPLNKKISPHHVEQAPDIHNIKCHAPRERVSWNRERNEKEWDFWVTLHVSVWVEIAWSSIVAMLYIVTLHVSVWVEISVGGLITLWFFVTLHVSVWVEIDRHGSSIRFTDGHAPRERVSWNMFDVNGNLVKRWSRSTWACELKCLNRRPWWLLFRSRSTWACELKFCKISDILSMSCHAPRERVSWNL